MSLVTGYLKQITSAASDSQVLVRAVSTGVVTLGGALVVPGEVSVRARATDGFWSVNLTKGHYEISVKASNGQTAKRLITIEADDDLTYPFEELVVDAGPLYELPVGGARPSASATVAGLMKSDESVADPIAVTGVFWKANPAAVRAIANKTNNKVALVAGGDVFDWSAASVAADDGTSTSEVLRPDDTLVGNPGRWLKRATDLKRVTTLAEMKALPSARAPKLAAITEPEAPGVGKVYFFKLADVTAVDSDNPYLVVAPDDNGGRWFLFI